MDGQLHIRLDLRECQEVRLLQSKETLIVGRILMSARDAGATVRDYHFRPYQPEEGYTLAVTIEESFFIVQTWPECAFVNIDVMVCSYTRDNTQIARRLVARLREFFGGEIDFQDETTRGPQGEQS